MTTTIRQIVGDEMLDIMSGMPLYSFRASPPLADKEQRQERLRQHGGSLYFAAFEDGKPVACAGATAMSQQARGQTYGMGGIHNVTTHPAARRKGYARRVLAQLLAALRDDGRALSCLYPFRESFYEALGYASFPQQRTARFAPPALAPLLNMNVDGAVDLVLLSEGYSRFRDFMLEMQQQVHGLALVDIPEKIDPERHDYWLALAMVGQDVQGLMLYEMKGENWGQFLMRIVRFYYLTSPGKYLLLDWIARHAGQAIQVEMSLPAFELPETWLADLQIVTQSGGRPDPMGRVLDVAAIGGMHVGPGSFSARITDPVCPWNEGAWRFAAVDGALSVSRVQDADCRLTINALSSLIYGTHHPGDFAVRGWGDPSPTIQEIMRAMFPPMLPYLHESF